VATLLWAALETGEEAALASAEVEAEAFLSSTGTSFNFTPEEQAERMATVAKIQRLRLIMKTPNSLNYR
jgi:hypothetical protein